MLRAYAQGERVERLRAGDFQRGNTFERRCRKKQRGIAAVEFAIAVPILLLLMLATAELGRAIYQYNTLAKAVRDGVRYLSSEALKGTTGVMKQGAEWIDVSDKAKNVVVFGNPAGTGNRVLPDLIASQVAATKEVDAIHVRVGVTYPYVPLFGNILVAFNMTPAAIMRAL